MDKGPTFLQGISPLFLMLGIIDTIMAAHLFLEEKITDCFWVGLIGFLCLLLYYRNNPVKDPEGDNDGDL